jgi:DDE superfamily endonuclease
MLLSLLPILASTLFVAIARWLDRRSAGRLPAILDGLLFAGGRRTVTAWFRPAGITTDFRNAYTAVNAVGRKAPSLAFGVFGAVRPLLGQGRLLVAIDDTPTKRYGPQVEGAGIHRHPSAGPANEPFLYGHVFVTLAALARHPRDGVIALPLMADMYVREKDVPGLPPERGREFKTKLQLAAEQLRRVACWCWAGPERSQERWVVVDGGYAARPFLDAARRDGFAVVGRLRKDAALCDLPAPREPGQRGRPRIYGANRISLAVLGAQSCGWEEVECEQYGERVTKTVKTFLATWRPARGVARVVMVWEEDHWRAFFCTKPDATAAEVLSAAADRNALEQGFKNVKEVWGAGEQQVRNLHSNEGCFNLDLWMMSIVEAWAWDKEEEDLVDRQDSPWDSQPRRPSHADKRKAMQREALRLEIEEALRGRPTKAEIRQMAERLVALAA